MSLEPIEPDTALELYLADKDNELAEASLEAHEYRLGHFVRWCDHQDIENLNNLSGRQLQRYRVWRRDEGDLSPVSEKTQMDTLRVFIRWLETVDGVEQDLSQKVLSPDITPEQNSRDVMLDTDRAAKVLAHLEKYHYASIEHVTIALMWHTMMRVGAVHALDLKDYHPSEQYVEVRHRPEAGTPIKNQGDGERLVALSNDLCKLLDDWIDNQRRNMTDDNDRSPLLTTAQGRPCKTTLRAYVYRWTQPCRYDGECPHDRDPDECEATDRDHLSKCPSSVSPHAIRRGSITHSLNSDMPDKVVSDRANVSQEVIDTHYDRRTERERMEQRRDYLDDL
ncbi:tyrosine-type recombinase/integrase [Haloterrigena alkaliphila]|uniref:Site-specific integrase n=1 Tax=Haloterrigena alkaliphila TaxID=2816475 RepID=A0A8A2V9L4_9EURY|nr:site-specific integrase [Haloterrigena alkaliphila]QSW98161.1 tyrosine-type recombinase/integrase [Haloterrigena alkaliphila]